MYPNYPDMQDLIGEAVEYPEPPFPLPEIEEGILHGYSIGPEELGNSQQGLAQKYWMVTTTGDKVLIQKSEGFQWSAKEELFSPSLPPVTLGVSFDQLGNPAVFYQNTLGHLVLWYYNSQTGQDEELDLGIGKDPYIVFDYPSDPSDSQSDIILFYINSANQAVTRVQRERYVDEHYLGIEGPTLRLLGAGKNTNNMMQVTYDED